MVRALVIKELRESLGLAAIAGLASLYVLATVTGTRIIPWQRYDSGQAFPFVGDAFTFYLVLVAGGLAILLGLKQTAWEIWQGTFFFLLHRPMSRRRLFTVKLVVGASLLLVLTGALVLAYALWAATPGTHATPFYWSMTISAWQMWFSLLLLYFGAFLTGIRPGHWFGSKLAPLVASGGVAMLAVVLPWWWLSMAIVLVSIAVYVPSIYYYVATRDY